MIDLRIVSSQGMTCTYYCPDCERETGVPVELRLDFRNREAGARYARQRALLRFTTIHDGCGAGELDARLAEHTPSFQPRKIDSLDKTERSVRDWHHA